MDFCVYWPETGEVKCSGTCLPHDVAMQLNGWPDHYVYTAAVDDEREYIFEGAPAPRPALAVDDHYQVAATGEAEVTFSLPVASVIRHNGELFTTDGSAFAFTSDTPGVFVFEITPPFPYMPRTVTIEATDAV